MIRYQYGVSYHPSYKYQGVLYLATVLVLQNNNIQALQDDARMYATLGK